MTGTKAGRGPGAWIVAGICSLCFMACEPRPVHSAEDQAPEGESFFFVPPGFSHEGRPVTLEPGQGGQVRIRVNDRASGQPAPCRVCVVGADGQFYQPPENRLTPYSLTGEWPRSGARGNRREKAPWRYLGRFFYCTGEATVAVPAGEVRVEISRGFETRPVSVATTVAAGKQSDVAVALERTVPAAPLGYFGGDPHLHFVRGSDDDERNIFDLLEAEDVWFGTPLAYNEPAGPYAGFMEKMDTPQHRGLGKGSIKQRGPVSILSGQEYRSGQYGHLNLFLHDRLVFEGQSFSADEWPVYGHVGADVQSDGGYAFYAHGGYALEIYADAALGTVNGVELLQFGIYRGIGLADWYHMLNTGYRFPCVGASDYPACRFLSDCRTYVWSGKNGAADQSAPAASRPAFPDWLRGAAAGHSFVTTGPLLLLEVDGRRPGETIERAGAEPLQVTARVRVRCEVTPVSRVDLIVGGTVAHSIEIPADRRQGQWFELQQPLELPASTWIAARAWSTTPGGQPDAESHTNPVYVYLDGRKPFVRESLDAWVRQLDGQIANHRQRTFAKKSQVLEYFQQARDTLLAIRERRGLRGDEDPTRLTAERGDAAGFVADLSRPEVSDDELREFLKPVPPTPAKQAVEAFEAVDGFHMQLVAAEPLVASPVAAAFDENGQLYVCEMRDYPYKPTGDAAPLGTVRLLRDTDGDGTFDEAHVFADKLLWAAGVVPWKGGVFVAATPDIWYLKDTDGDFKADVKRRVYTGFGTGNQQAMVNNLQWGRDHWIYGATAGNGGSIVAPGRPDAPPIAVTGRDFRFDPETERFETITGTVQFGNTFDDWGNRFVCSESQPLLQVVLPDHYLARNPYLPSPGGVLNIAPGPVSIFRISPTERWRQIRSSRRIAKNERAANSPGASHHVVDAAAGVTVYRGGAYPAEFYGQVFVGDGQNNLVHRRELVPDGVVFQSKRVDDKTDFVRSPDIWFRPVNLINAPDGTLYCLDMSREVLESIHIPLDIVKHLDLKSGRNSGRIYRIAPPGFQSPPPPRLGTAATAELVEALHSPHGWWRDTAGRLLHQRQDKSAAAALRTLVRTSRSPQTRLAAHWALQGLGTLDDDSIALALTDEHPGVRENGLQLAEPRLPDSPALQALTCRLADDEVTRVRFQAAFSLGQFQSPEALAALARLARRDAGDVWMRTAILSSVSGTADRLLVELLSEARPETTAILRPLAQVVGVRNRAPEVARVLEALAARSSQADDASLLLDLGNGLKRSGGSLSTLRSESPGGQFVHERLSAAARTATSPEAPEAARVNALALLACAASPEHRALLARLLRPDQPESVQIAAVRGLMDVPDASVAPLLLQGWPTFLPEVRRAAQAALLAGEDRTLVLLQAAQQGEVSLVDIDGTRRDLLLEHRNQAIRRLAREVFGTATATPRRAVLAEYQSALKLPGTAAAGALLFDKTCAACHQVAGKGYAIGPNLASSPSRDPAALLGHILDPNQYVLPNYMQYVLVDRNGRTHTGLLAAQSATSVTLKKEKDETTTILRSEIDELVCTNKSLMPEGLEKEIPVPAMADLLAYLKSVATQSPADPNAERDFGTLPGLIEPNEK